MSDIIANAKRLLGGATPGPWEWIGYDLEQTFEAGGAIVMDVTCENPHLGGVVNVEITPEDERLIAAAPELAQALAEETYEYTYHIKRQGEWEPTRNMETHRQDWWDDRIEVVETVELLRASGFETRIVRRRVSPPEVANE